MSICKSGLAGINEVPTTPPSSHAVIVARVMTKAPHKGIRFLLNLFKRESDIKCDYSALSRL